MTSIAVNTSAAAPQNTPNASISSTGSTRSPASGQSASATVQTSAPAPRASYANAVLSSKKVPSGPGGNAASSSSTAPSQASGGASGQHARSASTTSVPVNGKSITPAVPTIGNSNGASTPFSGGQHSRKSSIATMPNGSSRGAPNIKFGELGTGPQTSGSAAAAGNNNLTAPLAQNPRASSPSPAITQPAASGGGLPPTPGAAKPIQFGDTTPQQRHVQPHTHNPPQGPGSMGRGGSGAGGHNRHDSAQSESAPNMPHGRGMPQAGRGRPFHPQGQYQNAQYGGGGGGQGGYNVGRGGYQGQNQHQQRNGPPNMGAAAPFPQQQFPNSPRAVPRSPAMSHVPAHQSPSMAPAIPTQQLYPQPHGQPFGSPQVPYMQPIYPPDPYYPPYGMTGGYQQYPQTSPRAGYSQPVPPMGQGGFQYAPQQTTPMSRSGSNIEIHRPPSSIGQHGQHGPPHGPHGQMMMGGPQHMVPPPQQSAPAAPPTPYRPPPKSKAILIRDPNTNAPVVPQVAAPVVPASNPVIVESPSPASGRTPSRPETPHNRSTSRSNKTAEDKRREMREMVRAKAKMSDEDKKTQDAKATEDKKKEEEAAAAAAAAAKAEEEAKAKAEAEAKAKAEAEAEEKAKAEAEAKAKAEAEEKAKAEAEAREAAEKEAAEKAAKEAAEKAAKEAEEAAAAKAKEEADAKAKAEAEAAEAEAKAKAEAEAEAAAESAKAAEAKSEADKEAPLTPAESPKISPPADGESMPPPSLKTAEKSRSKPSPLNLQIQTTESGLPSAQLTPQLTALRSARPVDNLKGLQYPEGIASPNPALNPLATATKFKYDKDFLMQFQTVFTEKPSPDWDQKMRETVGDSEPARPSGAARTPSGLGARSSSSRGVSMFAGGAMGSFTGAAGAGAKAASMSSMERFKHSTNAVNPLGAGALGSFPRTGSNMGRTNSSTSLSGSASGALPSSPRASNRSARGSSKRGNTGVAPSMERSESRQQNSQPTIPLSDVKPLPVSANRWTPGRLKASDTPAAAAAPGAGAAAAGADALMSPELVQRKVKAALNKMTPEKFDKISDQILEITGQSKHESDGRTLRQVIQLTFEKATDEAHWASMYAKFCKRMLETMDSSIKDENIRDKNGVVVTGGNLFRKYLLNRCQEEFERGWKVNIPDQTKAAGEEVTMLSDEYYIAAAAKRRGLGLVQFIGELFKLGMLTERIMNECVRKLLDFEGLPEDETVESLCKLLRTIGRQLDTSEKSRTMMDMYFSRITAMIDNKELNSRMRFMLMDILDLRKRKWESQEADKGPKTIQEVREEALKAQQEKEAISKANRNRPQPHRGDSRYPSGPGGYQQNHHDNKTSGILNTDELSKLRTRSNRGTSSVTQSFGPSSLMGPRSNSSRRGVQESGSRTPSAPNSTSHANPFSALQDSSHNDGNEATSSPPSNNNSPQVSNAKPVTEEA